jgi:predicted small lipoprotein YifL
MTTLRSAFAATLAIAVTVALAACGEKTLDTGDAESEIADKIEQQRNVRPKSIECPEDMKAKKGEEYTCTLTAPNGDELDVKLTMLDDDGKFEFEVASQ